MPELLCLGQVDDATNPAAAAGEIYFKSSSGYGMSIGTSDPLLLFETQDFAPQGPNGRCIARRVHAFIEYGGSLGIRITPITDFNSFQTAVTYNLAAPPPGFSRRRAVLDVPIVKACTWIRVKVEVLSRDGYFWLQKVTLVKRPLVSTYEQIAGGDV